jgi:diguanylate cyclase (GGDEF)-like protein
VDIDKFKNYNDSFGHQQGDVALRAVAQSIKKSLLRSTDLAARWGGEEFIVLLPHTEAEGAVSVAEKIRAAIENLRIPSEDPRAHHITVSIGVSTFHPTNENKISDFILTADNALYTAKESGRNRVVAN